MSKDLQQEIEKILNDNLSGDYSGYIYGVEPTCQLLKKLFLSKQIELLDKIYFGQAGKRDMPTDILNEKSKLQSELKQLG